MTDPSGNAQILRPVLRGQVEASLRMLAECIDRCPDGHWDEPIARYPFWQVAYHTLCFAEYYLSPGKEAFERTAADRAGAEGSFQPRGMAELTEEFPSRRFETRELLTYAEHCRTLAGSVLGEGPGAEGWQTLRGPSGFPRLHFARMGVHVYNARHIQHHAGQLSASLRRIGVDAPWVNDGWRNAD